MSGLLLNANLLTKTKPAFLYKRVCKIPCARFRRQRLSQLSKATTSANALTLFLMFLCSFLFVKVTASARQKR